MNSLLTLQSLLLLVITTKFILANEEFNFKCDNSYHKCIDIAECESSLTLLRIGVKPKICGFKESTSYVCCSQENLFEYFPEKSKSEEQCEKFYGKLSENLTLRIKEGSPSRLQKAAHVVALGAKTNNSLKWVCGGSLISDEFILTAAHCLDSTQRDVNLVRFQNSIIAKNKQKTFDVEILEIIPHPDYTPLSLYNDVALVRIAKLDNNSPYKPACLHHHKFLPPFTQFKASGYGVYDETNNFSKQLRQVSLNMIDYKPCNAVYEKIKTSKLEFGIDDQSQICARQRVNKNTCQGYSGGPLEYKDFSETMRPHIMIVGITSFDKSKDCYPGNKSTVGVYTRVSKYLPWIEEHVWPNER